MSKKITTLLMTTSLVAMSNIGNAQDLDYVTFEEIFGESVTVSANGKPQRASELSLTMDIISQEDIRKSAATTIPQLLRRVAGMDFQEFGATDTTIAMRGYNQGTSSRILVQINGRQVYLNYFGIVPWQHLPVQMSEIHQIEVIKGPNAALFGFNAVAAVINIVTKNPFYIKGGDVISEVGTDGHVNVGGYATISNSDKLAMKISGGYTDVEFYEGEPNTELRDEPKVARGAIDLIAKVSDNTKLGLEATYSEGALYTTIGNSQTPISDSTFSSLRASINSELSNGMVKFQAYQNRFDTLGAGFLLKQDYEEKLTVLQGEGLFNVSDQDVVRVSAEYRQSQAGILVYAVERNLDNKSNLETEIFSLAGMWNRQFSDNFNGTVAIRFDNQGHTRTGYEIEPLLSIASNELYNDLKYSELTFNTAARYRLSDTQAFRASFARAVQTPTAYDMNSTYYEPEIFGPIAITGNPTMRPTVIYNGEIGFDQKVSVINGNLRLTAFYQENSDLRAPVPLNFEVLNDTFYLQSRNVGDSKATGFEVELSGLTENGVEWGANYSFVKVTDNLDNLTNGQQFVVTEYENQSPKHHANIFINYETGPFLLGAEAYYSSSKVQPVATNLGIPYDSVPLDGYVLVDLHASYKVMEGLSVYTKAHRVTSGSEGTKMTAFGQAKHRFIVGLKASF